MSTLTEFRAAKDEFFGSDEHSPLTPGHQQSFDGLFYYEENPSLAFDLDVELMADPQVVPMQTSTGDEAEYLRWARIRFTVGGDEAQLTVYRDPSSGGYFLPFQDANAGGETYGAGRYLDLEARDDGRLHVDFNYAYNPYCAYNERWSCPLPPAENRLTVALRAGEKIFDDEH